MRRFGVLVAACVLAVVGQVGVAQAPVQAFIPAPVLATGKTHHVVFGVTSNDEKDWELTLGNIRNLISGLKPDPVEVEVVAYAGGLSMVKVGSTAAVGIAALEEKGVRFVACQNAMRFQHVEAKDLLPGVGQVPAGIIEVVTRQEQGWAYIKGGR